ncbi:MAG TPA: LysM peptidoglycan-binding domain-containing protein, partial [Candidatus Saccharimonadales bacterium]|nr:LysM peptidoglycan-binding domain-containing protein [Candidatus Saccharimonadales bacterium]
IELAVTPADSLAVAKPQALSTTSKTKADITEYTVQAGENVSGIAAKFGVTSESIMGSNNLRNNNVAAGTTLLIPPINGLVYTVKAGDTPDTLAQRFRANKDQLIAFNDVELTGLKVGERIVVPGGQVAAPVVSRPFVAVFGSNGYDAGWCTYYAAARRAQLGRAIPSNFGDAWTWDDRAAVAGYTVNRNPASGAVAVTSSTRRPGHVAVVEVVNADGSVWISEMNSHGQKSMTDATPYGGWGKIDWKLIPADQARSINYIH